MKNPIVVLKYGVVPIAFDCFLKFNRLTKENPF